MMKKLRKTLDPQDRRLLNILEVPDLAQAGCTRENQSKYLEYLRQHLSLPCQVTGIEDMGCFAWEEYYTFGPGKPEKYEKLKKKQPSFTDHYELLELYPKFHDRHGIFVKAKRLSDGKYFDLTLCDLEAIDPKSPAARLLHDYAYWYCNFR